MTHVHSDACSICGQPELEEMPAFPDLRRVTSDCRPWPAGGRLCVCRACGGVQKPADDAFVRETAEIYADYSIYHQGGGAEQAVFTPLGHAVARSLRLVKALQSQVPLPATARLLDIGCGNGATLRAFSEAQPNWSLVGIERDGRCRAEVESIARVEAFHASDPRDVPGLFDVITLVHVLEHIPLPLGFLAGVQSKLLGRGLLVVEVPDFTRNPFDLLVADHSTHFIAATLALLLERALGAVVSVAEEWVTKELTAVARIAAARPAMPATGNLQTSARERVENDLAWLLRVIEAARSAAQQGDLGLFGTSIAATWLFAELGGAVSFFVDEDPHRAGRMFLGRSVYHPADVPAGSQVFLALPNEMARGIRRRMTRDDVVYHLPPER